MKNKFHKFFFLKIENWNNLFFLKNGKFFQRFLLNIKFGVKKNFLNFKKVEESVIKNAKKNHFSFDGMILRKKIKIPLLLKMTMLIVLLNINFQNKTFI